VNPFKQLISDEGGAPSTMRVMGLVVVLFVIPPMMVVWVILSLRQNAFVVPPSGFITLLSVVFGTKSLQSLAENFTGIHINAAGGTPALPGFPAPTPQTPNSAGDPGANKSTQS
jgi:hypothetical protein